MRVLRALARHWIAHLDGDNPTALADAWEGEGFRRPYREETKFEAWTYFANYLNAALRPFHARIIIPGVISAPNLLEENYGLPLYALTALQLLNFMSQDCDLRRCQSETCGRWFSRQRGGAVHGQYRSTGVLYCEPSCARAQANREYRRRKKAGS